MPLGDNIIFHMTPAEAFASKGKNPNNGLSVHDWYALGCVFFPQTILIGDKPIIGLRQISVLDMASFYTMHFKLIPCEPTTATADDVIGLLKETFDRCQKPRCGVVVGPSVWYSSQELLFDEDTAPRCQNFENWGIEFAPMTQRHKDEILTWCKTQGVRCLFNADQVS